METPAETAGQAVFYVEYSSYGSDEVTAYVTTDQPVMVVFSELYYPGWKAMVDGKPSKIWKTNYAFRGVVVEQGEHLIEMRYEPLGFLLGLIISLVTVGSFITVSIFIVIRRVRRSRSNVGGQETGVLN